MKPLLGQRLEASAVLKGLLVEGHGNQYGLRLLSPGQHDRPAEDADLGDDLGHVRADLGDSHLVRCGVSHTSSIHTRRSVMSDASVALYNSRVSGSPTTTLHTPP